MAGGLIRDGHGDWVVGFQRKIEQLLLVLRWSVGLRYGLKVALEPNLQGVFVETNFMALVRLLDEKYS
ncbi:hypothetical protein RHMOL_Rhmol12G0070300 [Rhododendron molle]|uniref:Uncharacterized protein n=1 Tax=Rhododendron molle TaxID=49168 RepID=A0ACC0LGV8_RHOML|nr:hypothetical protein RHMOL_Rhmol12G0070300 [Rhododendron molle]